MIEKVTRGTMIDGQPIGYETVSNSKKVADIPAYKLAGKEYLLLEDPISDQGYYSAKAVRLGDKIEFSKAPVHELQWKLLTPAEYGLQINENTIIDSTEWGTLTVSQLLEKQSIKEPIFINGKGYFVPIKSDRVGKEGKASVQCVMLEDSFYGTNGNEIRIYDVSYKPVRNEDIKSYMDIPEFVPEFKGTIRLYVNSNEMHEVDICDWDHLFDVKENVGQVPAKNLHIKERSGNER